MTKIEIPEGVWQATWEGLRRRGNGVREAACIWAGKSRDDDCATVSAVLFLEDYGDVDAGALHHCTSRNASRAVFQQLRQDELVIVADVHTHPDSWVDLSPTDRAHPIEYRPGLIAIVLPHFATLDPDIASIGVHEYIGDGRWQTIARSELEAMLRIVESR